jgi:hypothetical protein
VASVTTLLRGLTCRTVTNTCTWKAGGRRRSERTLIDTRSWTGASADLHLAIEDDDIGACQEFGVNVRETTETMPAATTSPSKRACQTTIGLFARRGYLFSKQALILFVAATAMLVLSMIGRRPATLQPDVRWKSADCQPGRRLQMDVSTLFSRSSASGDRAHTARHARSCREGSEVTRCDPQP